MLELTLLFVLFYTWHVLGITVGYHRLLSHRAFSCPKAVEYLFVLAGYMAFQGSPIWWATIHRAHHRYVDTPLDPHSPRFGIHTSYFGWLMRPTYAAHVDPHTQSKDLLNDHLYVLLEQGGDWQKAHMLVFLVGFAFRLLVLMLFGWHVALASLLAAVAVHQVPFLLNVVCHTPRLGYKTFPGSDDSVNVWWVALLAMGEGWHNNHHAFPGSARSGLRWFEVDSSWLLILLMKRIGLVHRVTEVSVAQYARAFRASTHLSSGNNAAQAGRAARWHSISSASADLRTSHKLD